MQKTVNIQVEENYLELFLNIVNNLKDGIVHKIEIDKSDKVLENIKQGFKEVKQIEQGKLKGKLIEELLNEL